MVVAVDDLLVTSTGNLIEYDQVRSSILEGRSSLRDRSYLDAPGTARASRCLIGLVNFG